MVEIPLVAIAIASIIMFLLGFYVHAFLDVGRTGNLECGLIAFSDPDNWQTTTITDHDTGAVISVSYTWRCGIDPVRMARESLR